MLSDENKLAEIIRELNAPIQNEGDIYIDDPEAMRAKMGEIYAARQKRQNELKDTHLRWFSINNGKPGAPAAQPSDVPKLYDQTQMPENEELNPMPRGGKSAPEIRRFGRDFIIRANLPR